ncbi:MAG: VCBS repeat-containing protein, partial [Desulfovibrionaceae bacterium]|nr:VCBS repeat-containing protein [Desulfovibrionaceae bacterium]
MKLCFKLWALVLMLMLGQTVAWAQAKQAVIFPFNTQAPANLGYLGKAVPAAIQNKLQTAGVASRIAPNPVRSAQEARRALGGADYGVFGQVSVQGQNCTIILNTIDKSGKSWTKTPNAPLTSLTGSVQSMTQAMAQESMGVRLGSTQGLGLTPGSSARAGQVKPRTPGASSDIIVNETGQQYYLNPQFRYQGASAGDSSRLRSQRLKINMTDMAVDDFNGDGRNEVAILDSHHLYMFVWGNDGRLRELGKVQISQSNVNFIMRAIDLNHDGAKELVITTYDEDKNRPYTFFYSFKGNR